MFFRIPVFCCLLSTYFPSLSILCPFQYSVVCYLPTFHLFPYSVHSSILLSIIYLLSISFHTLSIPVFCCLLSTYFPSLSILCPFQYSMVYYLPTFHLFPYSVHSSIQWSIIRLLSISFHTLSIPVFGGLLSNYFPSLSILCPFQYSVVYYLSTFHLFPYSVLLIVTQSFLLLYIIILHGKAGF